MKFPWSKYEEIKVERRNTLQVFITSECNLKCKGCFVRNIMDKSSRHISVGEYERAVFEHKQKGGEQINLLGGEPLLHPDLSKFISINNSHKLKTTIYTNGYFLKRFNKEFFKGVKLRVSIYSFSNGNKSLKSLPLVDIPFDANFMVSKDTSIDELIESAKFSETYHKCKVFFISSLRELDNPRQEFFDDTDLTMPLIKYKELVHRFLDMYEGDMEIHVSKRGVFESTLSCGFNKCCFANYFIGRKIIQCPYDIINQKYQNDYEFNSRFCQHNSTCLMTKVVYKRISCETPVVN